MIKGRKTMTPKQNCSHSKCITQVWPITFSNYLLYQEQISHKQIIKHPGDVNWVQHQNQADEYVINICINLPAEPESY